MRIALDPQTRLDLENKYLVSLHPQLPQVIRKLEEVSSIHAVSVAEETPDAIVIDVRTTLRDFSTPLELRTRLTLPRVLPAKPAPQ